MVLSFAIWLPIFFGLVVLMFGSDRSKCFVRWMALFGAIVSFAVTLPLITTSTPHRCDAVRREGDVDRALQHQYHLGVDGISMWFVVLTAFITVIVVISAWEVITERVASTWPRS
jgi:NADH-quinone oxidoreductase subunit M